ncbi:ComF family protein [Imbroritus primus]
MVPPVTPDALDMPDTAAPRAAPLARLGAAARGWLRAVAGRAFPDSCRLCGMLGTETVCTLCQDSILQPVHRCLQCALPLTTATLCCGACLRDAPPYARTITLGDYALPQAALVTALKYRAELPVARWLAQQLANAVQRELVPAERPSLLLPVPLSRRRLQARGFNQAWEITRHLARTLGCAASPVALQRRRDTTPQPGLSVRARRANLRNAFTLPAPEAIRGRHVGLVDDVMTSGATLHAAARLLMRHGAARVTLLVALRTPR